MRPATLADAPAMARVHLESALTGFADIFPPDAPAPTVDGLTAQWEVLIGEGDSEPRSRAFAAYDVETGEVVGTAVGGRDPAEPSRGHLRSLYVLPAWWGEGIGGQLHDVVVDHLRAGGFTLASLWVMEKNPARGLYERRGWRQSPDRQTIWTDIDEVRYLLALDSQLSPRKYR